MGLFQTSVLKKYRKLQDKKAVEKAYKIYTDYFHNDERQENIRESKEEQFQEGFLRELFVKVFDYTLNPEPQFNITTELKNEKGAKKADGAILKDGKALAVIELKSTKTKDLESVRQQAFDYKANQSDCVYVITSNFEKLRFYINNAVDFEEFNLFTLNEEQFELLYICLHKENILNNVPLKIKTDSVVAEESITKKFYSDYSQFKRELFIDLVKQNLKNEIFSNELQKEDPDRATKNIKQLLYKKSQKLIDRFLFIFFAEDKGLLPPNSTLQILDKWKADCDFGDERPLYDLFKQYFKFLDIGREGTQSRAEIFAYNGGLFKPDPILDNLILDNELLYKHTKTLSNYDFESQIGVNILGHIFENSLNEIESVNAEIEGKEFDKQKTKRKKDGVFYTPKYITKYIVDNTVGKLCEEKKQELEINEEEYQKSRKGRKTETLKSLKTKLDSYRNWLLTITILDPACGSGAFLNQALDFLIKEHTYIDELETSLLGGGMVMKNIENTILENNIYGVDLNEESVEIAKLSLWLRTAQPRRKLNTLNNNIKCGNSLIDSKEVAGDKAFNWQNEFPHIFKEKEKKIWHITTATHNSRYSQRMFDNNVKTGDAIWLDNEDEIIITKTIAEIVKENNLNVIEYNICGDHMHLLLVCEEEELTNIVGKIKGKTARLRNSNKGINPLVRQDGEKAVSLWTQKFGKSEIKDENYLNNAIEYIRNNRIKHKLPENKEIEKLKKEFLCSIEQALKQEYIGGFDVVIGNPPYVQVTEFQSFYEKNFSTNKCGDLYALFYEKGIDILKNKGRFSYITPSLFIKGIRYETLRSFLLSNTNIIEIDDKGDGVFQDVQMPTAIFVASKQKVKNQSWEKFIHGGNIINKIENGSKRLEEFSNIKRGLEIGKDKVFEYSSEMVKIITGEDVSRYFIKQYKSIEVGTYHEFKKEEKYFNGERLLIRETGNRITALYVNENIQQNRSLYSILIENIDYKYILGLINSSLMQFYYKSKFAANTDVFPKIRIAQVKALPIKLVEKSIISVQVENLISSMKDFSSIEKRFSKYLQSQYNIEKLSQKLQNWHELKFSDFINELNKAIKAINGAYPLGKKEEFEWMELFEEKKAEAQTLKSEIEKTDKQIDQMVYQLYGLTEEEIKIVEESV